MKLILLEPDGSRDILCQWANGVGDDFKFTLLQFVDEHTHAARVTRNEVQNQSTPPKR
jgi:hypothetical protein